MATTRSSSTSTSASKKSSSTKKAPAKKSSSAPRKRASAPRAEADRPPYPSRIAAEAARQLIELTGKDAEGVVGLDRSDDGWKVEVDGKGSLQGYRRVRRYVRGVPGED